MFFKFRSIKKQINVASGISLGAAITVMVVVGVVFGNNLYRNASETTSEYAEQLIGESLKRVASDLNVVEQTISDAVRITQDMASNQIYLLESGKMAQFSRDDTSDYVRHMLASNSNLLGAYITWEKNRIDSDTNYTAENISHSTSDGQFAPYWTRAANGTLDVRPASMASAYNGTTPNARGVRGGEWYLCSAENLKSCVSDPAVWDVQGKPTLMTSITSPIVWQNNLVGLAGVDLSMSFIQQLIEKVNKNIYQGAGRLKLISYHGYIIADTRAPQAVGEELDNTEWQTLKSHIQAGQEQLSHSDTAIELLLPLKFKQVEKPWSVVLTIPTEVALQQVEQLNTHLKNDFSVSLTGQLISGLVVGLLGFAMVFIVSKQIASPVRRASQLVSELSQSEGDLTKRIRVKTDNEIGQMSTHLNSFLDKTHNIVKETCDKVTQMRRASEFSKELSAKTQNSVARQEKELSEVSSAVEDTSKASHEVANNCANTADSAQDALEIITQCEKNLVETVSDMKTLTKNMHVSSELVDSLEKATGGINQIVEVIQAISEQTNLLALNAAIEAARAGEHGRGFSVVADEVRNLANRTKESTIEIHTLIESLTENSAKVVETTHRGRELCEANMDKAQESQKQLQKVVVTTKQISDASNSIAAAVEEQNQVTTIISTNISNINEAVRQVSDFARENNQHNQELDKLTREVEATLKQFKY
ncbi:MAG: methyl-accepting chemotaxis protein [Aestuariibacter sp.]